MKIDKQDQDVFEERKWRIISGYLCADRKKQGRRWRETISRVIAARIINRPLSPTEVVDHINRDPLDNRRENLRVCTQSENIKNRIRQKNTKNPTMGVNWDCRKKLWRVRINVDGKRIYIGRFKKINIASAMYITANLKYFQEYSPYHLNFLSDDSMRPPTVALFQ